MSGALGLASNRDIPEDCPVCGGLVELTPSGALVCREKGSTHLRIEGVAPWSEVRP